MSDFFESVYAITRRIPAGRVTTYGHIAEAISSRSAARMVGWALNRCPAGVPAHRVVNAQGLLTGKQHFPGTGLMKQLLENEGVSVNGDRVDLEKYLWIPKGN